MCRRNDCGALALHFLVLPFSASVAGQTTSSRHSHQSALATTATLTVVNSRTPCFTNNIPNQHLSSKNVEANVIASSHASMALIQPCLVLGRSKLETLRIKQRLVVRHPAPLNSCRTASLPSKPAMVTEVTEVSEVCAEAFGRTVLNLTGWACPT